MFWFGCSFEPPRKLLDWERYFSFSELKMLEESLSWQLYCYSSDYKLSSLYLSDISARLLLRLTDKRPPLTFYCAESRWSWPLFWARKRDTMGTSSSLPLDLGTLERTGSDALFRGPNSASWSSGYSSQDRFHPLWADWAAFGFLFFPYMALKKALSSWLILALSSTCLAYDRNGKPSANRCSFFLSSAARWNLFLASF